MKRLTIAASAAAVVASLVLSGCTGSAGRTAAPGTDKTIDYWGFSGGVSSDTAKSVIAAFEKSHPDFTVNAVTMETSDFDVKLPSTLGQESGPDLVYTGTEPNHLGRYVKVGQVSNLKDVLAQRGWDKQAPSTQERLSYDGSPFAVGNELETVGLMYNQVILDRLNIPVPKTLSELEAAMKKIKSSGDTIPMVLACGGPCYAGLHMMHALGYATIPTAKILGTTPVGTADYTDPAWVAMLEKFKKWNTEGFFTPDASGIPDENHTAGFCTGTTAFMVKGPWMFSAMAKCEQEDPAKFKFGFTGFPVSDDVPFQAYVGTGKAWFLASALDRDPAKRAAVLDLVSAFTDASTFSSWMEKDGLFPAMAFDPAAYKLTEPQKSALKIMNDAGKNGGAVDIGFNNSAEETQVWVSGLQGILSGTSSPQDLATKLQAQLEKDRAAWKAQK